jgi:hypothetical protein
MPGVLYTVRTRDGLELGPVGLEDISRIVQEGQLSSTSMIFRSDTKRWHLAASIPEIRALLRKFNPRRDSHISRLRKYVKGEARDSRQFSFRVSAPSSTYSKTYKTKLLYKIFPFLKKKK